MGKRSCGGLLQSLLFASYYVICGERRALQTERDEVQYALAAGACRGVAANAVGRCCRAQARPEWARNASTAWLARLYVCDLFWSTVSLMWNDDSMEQSDAWSPV